MRFITWILLLLSVASSAANNQFTPNVMGPLWLDSTQKWQEFDADLNIAKQIGVRAVTIDVWWGAVEGQQDQVFDWQYYDKVFSLIEQHQLQIIPIMSFHQCGGNVGDDCNIPIPKWLWTHFQNYSSTDLRYQSEQGNFSKEYLSLWANAVAIEQYQEFMRAFSKHYRNKAYLFDELNVSMGPAGELRLPSYNQHDEGTNYPTRGAWQVYGRLPTIDFQQHLEQQYTDIAQLNSAWQSNYQGFDRIDVPLPEKCSVKECQDTIDWFHSSLVAHGKQLLLAADQSFTDEFQHIPLGYKIPGIHWLMAKQGKWHRAAEVATGLLPAKHNFSLGEFGYSDVISVAKTPLRHKRDVYLHFTTLEMSDNPAPPAYSMANTLVDEFTKLAQHHNVIVKGENSLAAGVMHSYGWDNINRHFDNKRLTGITVLRLRNVAEGQGKKEFHKFIKRVNTL